MHSGNEERAAAHALKSENASTGNRMQPGHQDEREDQIEIKGQIGRRRLLERHLPWDTRQQLDRLASAVLPVHGLATRLWLRWVPRGRSAGSG